MTGIIVLATLALAIVAALEISNRRHSGGPKSGLSGSWDAPDRDVTRTKTDLLALSAQAGPFTHKPFGQSDVPNLFTARRARHSSWQHGRHAA